MRKKNVYPDVNDVSVTIERSGGLMKRMNHETGGFVPVTRYCNHSVSKNNNKLAYTLCPKLNAAYYEYLLIYAKYL